VHLFFDLDGTLTDSAPGIVRCINHALEELGAPRAPDHALRRLIGTPLQVIFEGLLASGDPALLERAVRCYRDRFNRAGMYENELFPGILEALEELRASGHTLQVVTVKPAVVARRVLDHFEITRLFDAVHGPGLDEERCDKALFVGSALEHARCSPDDAIMIGDRLDDVRAARARGVKAIGVGWGYGDPGELLEGGATCVVNRTEELISHVTWQTQRCG
jgi:phosphoglycolate phosphatase